MRPTENKAKIVHYYTTKRNTRYGSEKPVMFKQLCDGVYREDEHDAWASKPSIFTTALTAVTCKYCLYILIPKKELELSKMRANLLLEKEEGPSVAQMPEANVGTQTTST